MHKLNELGWWAFVIGWAMLIIAPFSWLFYAVPLLVAVALGVILMVRDRVASGVKLLLCVFAVPSLTLLLLFVFRTDIFLERLPPSITRTIVAGENASRSTMLANLEIYGTRVDVEAGFMTCSGRVHNTGTDAANWIRVGVLWSDESGSVLTRDVVTVVAADLLSPGNARRFEVRRPHDPHMKLVDAYIMADDEP